MNTAVNTNSINTTNTNTTNTNSELFTPPPPSTQTTHKSTLNTNTNISKNTNISVPYALTCMSMISDSSSFDLSDMSRVTQSFSSLNASTCTDDMEAVAKNGDRGNRGSRSAQYFIFQRNSIIHRPMLTAWGGGVKYGPIGVFSLTTIALMLCAAAGLTASS